MQLHQVEIFKMFYFLFSKMWFGIFLTLSLESLYLSNNLKLVTFKERNNVIFLLQMKLNAPPHDSVHSEVLLSQPYLVWYDH